VPDGVNRVGGTSERHDAMSGAGLQLSLRVVFAKCSTHPQSA